MMQFMKESMEDFYGRETGEMIRKVSERKAASVPEDPIDPEKMRFFRISVRTDQRIYANEADKMVLLRMLGSISEHRYAQEPHP